MSLKYTPLFPSHEQFKARMVDFSGWSMPVQYTGLVAEHQTVRNEVGLFDVSHMGQVSLVGRGSLEFLQTMTLNDVSLIAPGQAQYSAFANEQGGIIDDIIIYRRGLDSFFLCVNAGNVEKDMGWLKNHLPTQGVELRDVSEDYALIALQGPKSRDILTQVVDIQIQNLPYYAFAEGKLLGVPAMIARTGYTGELGYELYLPASSARVVWDRLLNLDAAVVGTLKPCGLGARDTLRLEMGYLLCNQDMDETTSALSCGLGWIIGFQKEAFIGKQALLVEKEQGSPHKLVGFEMKDRAIARSGYLLYGSAEGDEPVGRVTSGSPSPSLSKNIGMGYVLNHLSKVGTEIFVEIRGVRYSAQVVKRPFYTSGTTKL